jgi:hypothetical protein
MPLNWNGAQTERRANKELMWGLEVGQSMGRDLITDTT